MPGTTFYLTPEQETNIKAFYPAWPWVDIGQGVDQNGATIQIINLQHRMTDEALKQRVDRGRLHVQKLLESGIDERYRLLLQWHNPEDESGNKWQRKTSDDDDPSSQWTVSDTSGCFDNRGPIFYDKHGRSYNWDNVIVDRRFDHILSVLESLPVGPPDGVSAKTEWEHFRTVNCTVFPHGPNMRFRMHQDIAYHCLLGNDPNQAPVQVPPTHAVHEAFYNFFDGVIVVTKTGNLATRWRQDNSSPVPKSIPPPRHSNWRDLVWCCWEALHRTPDPSSPHPSDKFVPEDQIDNATVSGRCASPWRATASFYQSTKTTDMPRMKSFLNYVIFYGDAIGPEDVAVMQRLQTSRRPSTDGSRFHVWGYHETFQVGHWGFYAMLGTFMGSNLASMLAEHKGEDGFGHKTIESCTIFAVDSVLTDSRTQQPRKQLVKWPAVIWKIVDFNADLQRQAKQTESNYVDDNTGQHKHEDGQPENFMFPDIECTRLAAPYASVCPRVVLPSTLTSEWDFLPGNMIHTERYDGSNIRYL